MSNNTNQNQQLAAQPKQPPLTALASRLNVDEQIIESIVVNTLVSAKKNQQPTNEEFFTFLAIANEHKLNPLTKEIYAFANRGTVQVIVSIDGWLKIINGHSQFDGLETVENFNQQGQLESITCKIFRKDRSHATVVTEYLAECKGNSEPWTKWPARMLRHKALIQCARYAFGLSGIIDEDEAERIKSVSEKDITSTTKAIENNSVASEQEILYWTGQLQAASNMEEYQKLKNSLVSQYGGAANTPIEIKQLFSDKMLELAANDNT